MSRECDPLLPRDQPAPEISGDGYSKLQAGKSQEREAACEDDYQDSLSSTNPLKTFIALFAIVVTVAFLISLAVPGGLGFSRGNTKHDDLGIKARVEKIMSEYPLIG